ncbi:MAG: sigma-70 family RNA polymerase sigma factor [Rubripirellula sp.]|nr:sigma-70 family RNA polymerase sigma factor [Rubripirellula sp.]
MSLERHRDQPAQPLSSDEDQVVEARSMGASGIDSDAALIRRMLSGENAAWVEFVTRYDALIHARVHAAWREAGLTVLSPEAAAEISAEVIAGLLNNEMKTLRSYGGRSRLSTWLSVIVRRATLRYLHSLRKQHGDADLEHQADHRDEQRQLRETSEDRIAVLRVARKKLSPEDQHVLQMFYERGCSYQQLAADLGISINAIGPKLDRARRRLREKTEEMMAM